LSLLSDTQRKRLEYFFGLNLPRTRMELGFDLVRPKRKGTKPWRSKKAIDVRLTEAKEEPTRLFEQIRMQTRYLNRYSLGQIQRLSLTTRVMQWFYPAAYQQMQGIAKVKSGIPEDAYQRELLDLIADTTRALITSYQLVFQADYQQNRFWYARARRRIYQCAFRILELIKLEQRLCGLRFQTLNAKHWRLANTLYRAIRDYENVELPLPSLDETTREIHDSRTPALQDIYAAIQIFWILDPAAWPERTQSFIHTYCNSVDQGIIISDYDGGTVEPDSMVTQCYRDRPPSKVAGPAEHGPPVLIDYRILARTMRDDYRELFKARAEQNNYLIPRNLRPLEPIYQLVTGRIMSRNLDNPRIWEDLSHSRQQQRDLRIYTGFGEVQAHLLAVFSGSDTIRRTGQMSDLLAMRSAKIGEDESSTEESLWYVLYQDERRLRLKTQETRFTNPMQIGTILAYGFGDDEILRPRIGKVSRLHHPEPGHVVIDIDHLTNYAAPVQMQKMIYCADHQQREVTGKPAVALLTHDTSRGWGALIPYQDRYWEGAIVELQVGRNKLQVEFVTLLDVSPEFMYFRLDERIQRLRSPTYPFGVPSA